MKASMPSDRCLPAPSPADPPSITVLDGEAVLAGQRGPVGVTISVRLFESTEIWLYAAECAPERPARGLWRWRQGRWETLCGGESFHPHALAQALADGGTWVHPPPEPHGEQVRGLLRLAAHAQGTAAGRDGRAAVLACHQGGGDPPPR